jgi:hypothetical protein
MSQEGTLTPLLKRNFEIGRILHFKSETQNFKMDWLHTAESSSPISNFGFRFEMDSSNFEILPVGITSSILPQKNCELVSSALSRSSTEGKKNNATRRIRTMKSTNGQFTGNQVKDAYLLRIATTLLTILLASVSAWAGDHQICYQIPPSVGLNTIAARFLCRTDGTNSPGCQITSVQPGPTSPAVSAFGTINSTPTSAEAEAIFSAAGSYIGTIQFNDGTVRSCTVEIMTGVQLKPTAGNQLRTLIGFNTDSSGLVMTGIWQATSPAAVQASQQVIVPPDFVAVGGGSEGTEGPQGTLVTSSIHHTTAGFRFWLGGIHNNFPSWDTTGTAEVSPVTAWGIGLKIEGISIFALQQIVNFPNMSSTCCVGNPTLTMNLNDQTLYPQTTATPAGLGWQTAIGGGVQAQQGSGFVAQYVTRTQPLYLTFCFVTGGCERRLTGWMAESKEHTNTSPWFVVGQMTTVPKVLTINGSTFHVETLVAEGTGTPAAHPSTTASLPGDFALTGIGAFVDWKNSPSAFGNLVWRLKPRSDINGVEAASKDQWFSSPAGITAFAIGMKLVPGPVPFARPVYKLLP